MISRLKKWWKYRFTKWVETGECWHEYETVGRSDFAAKVQVYMCREQMHEDTGETRVKRVASICTREPTSEFDSDGNLLWSGLGYDHIPPAEGTEPVIGGVRNE